MSIPISANEKKKWVDPKTGATYFFSYLTGDRQDDFLELQNETLSVIKRMLPIARKDLESTDEYKSADKKEKSRMVTEKAQELATLEIDNSKSSPMKYSRKIIDIFLTGWEGKGFPEFPKDVKPSSMLVFADINMLSDAISGMMGDLYGLSVDDSKN
jgi:hypothetical protein